MQIVIEIDEEEYNKALDGNFNVTAFNDAVRKYSTPLPKGHGRLIDADNLEMDADWSDYYDGYTAYSEDMINCAPTIIEADKE